MSAYRLVVLAPDDEVLDTITLDGTDLADSSHSMWLTDTVYEGMGSVHAAACAALPEPDDD